MLSCYLKELLLTRLSINSNPVDTSKGSVGILKCFFLLFLTEILSQYNLNLDSIAVTLFVKQKTAMLHIWEDEMLHIYLNPSLEPLSDEEDSEEAATKARRQEATIFTIILSHLSVCAAKICPPGPFCTQFNRC